MLEGSAELEGVSGNEIRERPRDKRDKERQKERAKVEKEKDLDEGKNKDIQEQESDQNSFKHTINCNFIVKNLFCYVLKVPHAC